ncbi:MFS transporter [Sphingomonas sp. So64.6b]|uniref:MFS transporter n=1 Tax=Sphingomonas sp. So64.6b TaxID=2997354 RepID=UPI001602E676|nr:MFS transporter [Sphingomonas sp. So64.6b]QNA85486.1 MFS transporter [Sphingomonas sp. So64.6b]
MYVDTLDNRAIGLLAVVAGLTVANVYYVQPLIVQIGESLGLTGWLTGALPALSQLGLAIGLTFLLPLGDVIPPRRLLLFVIPAQGAALVLFCVSGSAPVVALASLLIGLFGITPYILPPYVSIHVSPKKVGLATGVLTRGVIIGILLARAISGEVGTRFGWRAVYGVAAIALLPVLFLTIELIRPEPASIKRDKVHYFEVIASLPKLFRNSPELRLAAFCQALSFGSFNVFWLGISLYLQGPAFHWTPRAVGLVAILGAIPALAAPIFGRLIDRQSPILARRVGLSAMTGAWLIVWLFQGTLPAMAVGLVLLDLGVTIADLSNRTILYGLDAQVRTRLNAVYQVAMFLGGAVMSLLVGGAWIIGDWPGICLLGSMPVLLALFGSSASHQWATPN